MKNWREKGGYLETGLSGVHGGFLVGGSEFKQVESVGKTELGVLGMVGLPSDRSGC